MSREARIRFQWVREEEGGASLGEGGDGAGVKHRDLGLGWPTGQGGSKGGEKTVEPKGFLCHSIGFLLLWLLMSMNVVA